MLPWMLNLADRASQGNFVPVITTELVACVVKPLTPITDWGLRESVKIGSKFLYCRKTNSEFVKVQ